MISFKSHLKISSRLGGLRVPATRPLTARDSPFPRWSVTASGIIKHFPRIPFPALLSQGPCEEPSNLVCEDEKPAKAKRIESTTVLSSQVTFANASAISDGAITLLLMHKSNALREGLLTLAQAVGLWPRPERRLVERATSRTRPRR